MVPFDVALNGMKNCTTTTRLKWLPPCTVRCALLVELVSPMELYLLELRYSGSINLLFGSSKTNLVYSETWMQRYSASCLTNENLLHSRQLGKKNQTEKTKAKENPFAFLLTCHERIDLHKPSFMEYIPRKKSANMNRWHFQKGDDFLDTFQRKYFCWFFKKLWVVFLKKATEWLPVKMQFWVLKLDSLICILNTLLKRQWQCLFSKRYKYKRKQFRNEIGRKIQLDLEKRFFNFCFGIFRKVLGKKSLSYNSSVLPIQDNHFGLLLLRFVLCRNSHLGHHMSPKYSLLL